MRAFAESDGGMIISPGRRYVFVHMPKTGGTSMALALEARAMADDILIGDTPKALKRRSRLSGLTSAGRLWKHSRLSDIDGIEAARDLSQLFVFTMVRNPWDRMVSLFYWLRVQSFEHPGVTVAKAQTFAGFLADDTVAAMLRADGVSKFLRDASGVERCDAFLRLEHLDHDIAPLEAHLGLKLHPLPHVNRSERPDNYRTAYDDATAERVADIFAADIARFGYAF